MPADIFSVGVDLGGTWIRLEAVDRHGRHVRALKKHGPSLSQLPAFLKRHLGLWKTHPVRLSVASRGVWSPFERQRLKRQLRTLAGHVSVMSDVEAAWHAAFKKDGIVVIAGTGSIGYGRNARGRSGRAGGLGPHKGDEGSAYWIGKMWLGRPHRQTVRRVAALAPQVLREARTNPRARQIIQEAQDELAKLVVALKRRLSLKIVPLSWAGGLLDNARFRTGFLKALHKHQIRFRVVQPRVSPALAVARL